MTGAELVKDGKDALTCTHPFIVVVEEVEVLSVALIADMAEVTLCGVTPSPSLLVVVDAQCLRKMECWYVINRQCIPDRHHKLRPIPFSPASRNFRSWPTRTPKVPVRKKSDL